MNSIITFVKRILIKAPIPPLGRWNINYCNDVINKKIDLANTDHCGPCGQFNESNSNLKIHSIVVKKSIPNSIIVISIKNIK